MDPVTPAADLVQAARAGDHRAFSTLLRQHDAGMRRLATRMLGSPAAMDDALQDAYLKAYRSLDRFRAESAFSTWLYSIVYRTCLDHIRARGRRPTVDIDLATASGAIPDAHDTAQQATDRTALETALAELSEDQRGAVLLVDGAGMSYAEAGEVLGVAEGTVASRLNRAHALLRAAIDEGGGDAS